MPKHFLLLLVLFTSLYSCQDQEGGGKGKRKAIIAEKDYPEDKELTPELPPPPSPYSGPIKYCFETENTEEGGVMQFVSDNDSVTGTLDYLPNQGLKIHGTISGILEGNSVNVIYTYVVDNVKKQEQMIFKFEKNQLFRKKGEMIERQGVLVLNNPSKSQFELAWEKVKCK